MTVSSPNLSETLLFAALSSHVLRAAEIGYFGVAMDVPAACCSLAQEVDLSA